mmetsp:Transcript_390/g.534  ORF Transcript_390/g.534 Transcript_390/m.534 type:complete len:91 (-) Transcript_390:343-615(-)|eukprot:CAMPEP_0174972522 /NCGR_PEP_ID=MMETSP0004_2-20121128/10678_1 /TAXON_ID=420556 /ORGANISM="Ochromonas sp., Strain CCMP1393" /LENGTH=90 /DNA_ID=CAMNT_0016222759 /DNA_START=37 /DNA_END=309 /DNA_ORIENTATION=+
MNHFILALLALLVVCSVAAASSNIHLNKSGGKVTIPTDVKRASAGSAMGRQSVSFREPVVSIISGFETINLPSLSVAALVLRFQHKNHQL